MGKLVFLAECIFSWMSYNYNTGHKNARISEIIRMADAHGHHLECRTTKPSSASILNP